MSDSPISGTDYFALVTYTPEPVRDWLIQLRRELAVETTSEPHITLLPPRPLTIPAEQARQRISSALDRWSAFEVELTNLQVFPGTNVLYLEISDGSAEIQELHSTLNAGEFLHQEIFDFHPHLTVGGPIRPEELDGIFKKAVHAWTISGYPCRFWVEEFAFVGISTGDAGREWNRLWSYRMRPASLQARAKSASVTNRTS